MSPRSDSSTPSSFARIADALADLHEDRAPLAGVDLAHDGGALTRLAEVFALDAADTVALHLAAATTFDAEIAASCQEHADGATLALAARLTGSSTTSTASPDAPLRRWQLVTFGRGPSLLDAPLSLPEWTQHMLLGNDAIDPAVAPYLTRIHPVPNGTPYAPLATALAPSVLVPAPCIVLAADPHAAAAALACGTTRSLYELRDTSTMLPPAVHNDLAVLLAREIRWRDGVLFVPLPADPVTTARLVSLCAQIDAPVVLASPAPPSLDAPSRPLVHLALPALTAVERDAAWDDALATAGFTPDTRFDPARAQFRLTPRQLDALGPRLAAARAHDPATDPASLVWETCRALCRTATDGLAERIDARVTWDDLVLPPAQRALLQTLTAQVKHRHVVYDRWGMAGGSGRGLGIAAVFAGQSGTGKTLAAEAIAHTLRLDLLHVDLSAVTSKYIGETEKNLARVFDAAETSGAVLLFDEADALFGKRSEVRDARDRYANLEVSYLLQRMEAYRGLSILTTNVKEAIDKAFLRRFRFVVDFPFPGVPERTAIWQRAFPPTVPTEGLDPSLLARFAVPGGVIRNVALHAAFLAADEGTPVRMGHLRRAVQTECTKMERALADTEIRGWE